MNEEKSPQESYSDWLSKTNDKSKSTVWVLVLSYIIAGGSLYLSLSNLLGFHAFSKEYLKLIEIVANFAIILMTLVLTTRNPSFDKSEAAIIWKKMYEKNYFNEGNKLTNFTYSESCYNAFSKRWKIFLEWLLYFYVLMFANWLFRHGDAGQNNILRISFPSFEVVSNSCLFTILTCFIFNIRSFNLWLCYRVLHDLKNPKIDFEKQYEETNGKFSHDRLLMRIAVILFAGIQYLSYLQFPEYIERINTISLIFSGIWGSFTLGMLATHFESRLINVPPFPVALILIYAAIHPLMFTLLENSGGLMDIGVFILFLALMLKIHLFLFTHFLYQKRKLMRYFVMMPVFSKNVREILD